MKVVDIQEATKHLSDLVEKASKGETFIIAIAGKPMARVTPYSEPKKGPRIGFMKGMITVPDDFDTMNGGEIEEMFSHGG